jgi:hypothetical protein
VNSKQLLRRNRIRPYLPDDTVLDAEAGAYNSPIIHPNDMAKRATDNKGRTNDITISGAGMSVSTNADELHELSQKMKNKRGKQSEMAGSGFDLPEPIQAISNAADELFDVVDEKAELKERYQKAELNVMALMRAAERKFYKHRDRTISIDGKETLKVEKPKKPRGGGEDRIGRDD